MTTGRSLCLRWGPAAEMVRLDLPKSIGGRQTLADPKISPFDIKPQANIESGAVCEDDVVHHLGALHRFDGKLAAEDSERLMTYLTVPYMSIPLVLGLFNRENIGAPPPRPLYPARPVAARPRGPWPAARGCPPSSRGPRPSHCRRAAR